MTKKGPAPTEADPNAKCAGAALVRLCVLYTGERSYSQEGFIHTCEALLLGFHVVIAHKDVFYHYNVCDSTIIWVWGILVQATGDMGVGEENAKRVHGPFNGLNSLTKQGR